MQLLRMFLICDIQTVNLKMMQMFVSYPFLKILLVAYPKTLFLGYHACVQNQDVNKFENVLNNKKERNDTGSTG